MNTAVTRRDLAERGIDALNPQRHGEIQIARSAGGVSFASVAEVIEIAKLMAVSDKAVPKHLRTNPGMCLRIVFQAVEWQMSPWAVADMSYEVNDRLAYMSQLIHAVIEARAPLTARLDCSYDGDGAERTCTVSGRFVGNFSRSYTTPKIKDIRVKNSPLWKDDPDQQLFYYGSRSWARKWCPDVIVGLYTRDELAENPRVGRDDEPAAPGLHARLVGGNVARDEGHRDGHTAEQLEQARAGEDQSKPRSRKKAKNQEPPPPEPTPQEAPQPAVEATSVNLPTNSKQWAAYARAWIAEEADAETIRERWKLERALRNRCGVTSEEREPVQKYMDDRCKELKAT